MQTKLIRQRRLWMMLPVLALPFVTFGFWALGGGSQTDKTGIKTDTGFNALLPDAQNKNNPMDKLSYYDQAALDSLKRKEQILNDPYHTLDSIGSTDVDRAFDSAIAKSQMQNGMEYQGNGFNPRDNETRVNEKLKALKQQLERQNTSDEVQDMQGFSGGNDPDKSAEVQRLEQMMEAMNHAGNTTGNDPETEQLNGMLEKILDIQHPEKVRERMDQEKARKTGMVYPVGLPAKQQIISVIGSKNTNGENTEGEKQQGFYSLQKTVSAPVQNAIEAVVPTDQILVNGATIKLRLQGAVEINGIVIPKDNYIYGIVSLNGERLSVKIKGLRFQSSLFPVSLSVFDLDGEEGIYIPGAIERDVAKESADRSIQALGISSMDPSIGAQAAGAGIEAAKTLLSRKVKLVKVLVKAGYKVLLKDEKQKEDQ